MSSMTRRYRTRVVAPIAALAVVLAACGGAEESSDTADDAGDAQDASEDESQEAGSSGDFDPVTLSFASFVTDQNPHMIAFQAWMEEVTERTGGAVTFDTFYGEALCAGPEINACTADGRVDIGFTTATYTPADFPVATVANVPFLTSNLQANVNALNQLYDESDDLRGEFESQNQHLLYFGPVGLPVLAMTTEITSLDDFDGLSIRAVGALGGAFEALGINPVAVAPAEQYESLQRGVLDGSAFTIDGHADFRHFEVADYWYDLGEYSGSYAAMHTSINLDTWNALDPQIQEIMTDVSDSLASTITSEFFLATDERDCATVVEGAAEFGRLQPEDAAEAWADEWGDVLLAEWIERADEAGTSDAAGLADRYIELLEEQEAANPDFRGAGEICVDLAS